MNMIRIGVQLLYITSFFIIIDYVMKGNKVGLHRYFSNKFRITMIMISAALSQFFIYTEDYKFIVLAVIVQTIGSGRDLKHVENK